ncbi:PREDICTED: leishmanolysin-like peptidase [Amphimedon queenslandica]|uniref:Leishmanolysin-like peptidase n=1 Tax=Amphimedon queenslandica TaxID=400682 RepID=A0AAN0IU58_AMPQE|nr:PREDICTED: leishmanolysin-like peptidase [Amphimedon queenslandica]|eukprot:XP_011409337.2 PREDICTED: leishmanolysin-like peptidase [Amphimedon queenslandica]
MEDEYDRPIAGYINFCSGGITSASSDLFIFTVAKHEVLHALGFSNGLFPWFRDENGNPRTPRNSNGFPPSASGGGYMASNNTVRVVTYDDWWTKDGVVSKTVTLLVTPKVVETGKIHFNCSSLEGVQLEDQGGSGTALSHWESRILENEAMTGIISSFPVFSNFTLALLEDSG